MKKQILMITASLLSFSAVADSPIMFGKFTHLKTEGKATAFILGNETWDVQYSPSNDGVFIWANRNSIPGNIRVYTAESVYTADIYLSDQEHVSEIKVKARSLKDKTATSNKVNLMTTNPVDKLIENANRAILEKKKQHQLEQMEAVPQPKQTSSVKILSGTDELRKKAERQNLAINKNDDIYLDENGIINITINGSSNKTVRQVVSTHFISKGWELIEYPGDERALDSRITQEITSLDELFHASVNIENILFLPEQRAFRVKPTQSVIQQQPDEIEQIESIEMLASESPTEEVEEILEPVKAKTIKELIQPYLQEQNLSLVELPGDERITNLVPETTQIQGLDDLYALTEGRISQIIIDHDTNTLRIKGY